MAAPLEYGRPLYFHLVVPCSNAVKMRNPLKFAEVAQTSEVISAASGLNFTIVKTCGADTAA